MKGKKTADLNAAFSGKKADAKPARHTVSEDIKNHAPQPTLKPGGSWAARANAVDRQVRESQQAAKAKKGWSARAAKSQQTQGKGQSLRQSFSRKS